MRTHDRGVTLKTREFVSWREWDTFAIARGTEYIGSWRDLDDFYTKTLVLNPTMGGSFHIIASVMDKDVENGTYYTSHVGPGSYTTKTWTEALKQAKIRFHATGTTTTGKGTLNVFWGGQT